MTLYRRVGDRRGRLRFEIVGELWGSLASIETVQLVNIGRGGALIEGPRTLIDEATVPLGIDGHVVDVHVRVRHVTEQSDPRGTRYLVGVEFVDLPADTMKMIDGLLTHDCETDPAP